MILFSVFEAICLVVFFCYLEYYILNIYQQEHYDYKKFVKILPTYYFKKVYTDILYICLILILFNNIYHSLIIMILTIFILIKPTKYIIKLKYTPRIIRLILTTIILVLIPFILIRNVHLILFIIEIFFLPFILLSSSIINEPIEIMIKKHYLKKATKKYYENQNMVKIAITGSYGKTTTKNILYHLLSNHYICLATPKSYNTLMGITKTINESLKTTTEVFIMEMGAFKKGEIRQMVKEFPPNISVITEIGPQHLSTFKSIEGVLNAKLEIISNQPYESSLVVNTSNKYLKNLNILSINDIIGVGYEPSDNYYIKDVHTSCGKTSFIIVNNNQELLIETPLLGEHNAINILICYGIIQALKKYNIDITDQEFINRIKSVPQVPHRLEYQEINNIHIYDDSYNSNLAGFSSAINLFKEIRTKKVIITPGIVDGGTKEKEINEEIALKLISQFDDIYLIRNKVIVYYVKVFNEHHQKYKIFNSFNDAFQTFKNNYNEEVSLLIENDLPDNFLER
ncbi:MAG: Mur ligase family protein [Bacilli bacterium]